MVRAARRISRNRFEFEQGLLRQGHVRIAGVDEAGRGPLAGPVVAAAVILPAEWMTAVLPRALIGLNDSKQLTEAERTRYYELLMQEQQVAYGIAVLDTELVDRLNILRATHRAMNEALDRLRPPPDHVLVDGLPVRSIRVPQTSIVQGDSRSYSIAAASVLAKVTRDRLMLEYDRAYPQYGFACHKGYGTAEHFRAIQEHGPCPIHRRSFAPFRPVQIQMLPG